MKIRIQGNSIRIRLSKSEVERLEDTGSLEERTVFAKGAFGYRLQRKQGITALSASYENDTITMFVPEAFLQNWSVNNVIGFEAIMPVHASETLYLLLEKDFKCLDNTSEDQSDNFENPNKIC